MAVELQAVGVSPGALSTTCVVVKPVGLTVGWLMIAHVVASLLNQSPTVSPPANWTEIRQDAASDDGSVALYWKIADSADVAASDFTFGISTSCSNMGAITAWTGHDPATPINAHNGQNQYSSTITSPAITPSVANCMILMNAAFAGREYTIWNYAIADDNPPSWTEAYDLSTSAGNESTLAMGYAIRPETTSTGLGTASAVSNGPNVGQLVAIAPAAAPPEEERHQTPHCGPKKLRTEWLSTMRM